MLMLNGKVMTIHVYQRESPDVDTQAEVRKILERLITRARELNPAA